jgi:hypothetical protein
MQPQSFNSRGRLFAGATAFGWHKKRHSEFSTRHRSHMKIADLLAAFRYHAVSQPNVYKTAALPLTRRPDAQAVLELSA